MDSDKSTSKDAKTPQFEDVVKRMLSTPPDPKVKAKPAERPAQNKPAK